MTEKKALILIGDYVAYSGMEVYQILKTLGYDVDWASPGMEAGSTNRTVIHYAENRQTYGERLGRDIDCSIGWDDVSHDDFDGMVIPGGRSPEHLRIREEVISLVKEFDAEDKPIASLCHGPLVVAAAGIVEGRKCIGLPLIRPVLEDAGGIWQEPKQGGKGIVGVATDGNLITTVGRRDHPEVCLIFDEIVESNSS